MACSIPEKPPSLEASSEITCTLSHCPVSVKVELQWLEHLWNYEIVFETGVVRAAKC